MLLLTLMLMLGFWGKKKQATDSDQSEVYLCPL